MKRHAVILAAALAFFSAFAVAQTVPQKMPSQTNKPLVVDPELLKRLAPQTPVAPFKLQIIDGGANAGTAVRVQACFFGANDVPAKPFEMGFVVRAKGDGAKLGGAFMQSMVITPGQAAGIGPGQLGVRKLPQTLEHCREGVWNFKQICSVAPGDYRLIVQARPSLNSASVEVEEVTTIARYDSEMSLSKNIPSTITVGEGLTIAGFHRDSCGGVLASPVSASAPDATTSVGTSNAEGLFTLSPIFFTKPGAKKVHVALAASTQAEAATKELSITVQPAPVTGTFINAPETMPVGRSTVVRARLLHNKTKAGLKDMGVVLRANTTHSCTAKTNAQGEAFCAITLPADAPTAGAKIPLTLALADPSVGLLTAQPASTKFVRQDGYIVRKIGASITAPTLAAARPGGVMFNNYKTGGEGDDAYLRNGSWLYLDAAKTKSRNFDVAPFGAEGLTYYLDRIYLNVGALTPKPPNGLYAPLSITGFDGRGPTLKGHCWTTLCYATDDIAAPDFTNISLNKAYIEIGFRVENGEVKAYAKNFDGSLGFDCGGLAQLICGHLQNYANGLLRDRVSEVVNAPETLAALGKSVDGMVQSMLPLQGIAKLTGIEIGLDGGISLVGTPKL